jgi:hypothetical protein
MAIGSGDQKEEIRYDQPGAGHAAAVEVRPAGTAGSPGDDQ